MPRRERMDRVSEIASWLNRKTDASDILAPEGPHDRTTARLSLVNFCSLRTPMSATSRASCAAELGHCAACTHFLFAPLDAICSLRKVIETRRSPRRSSLAMPWA